MWLCLFLGDGAFPLNNGQGMEIIYTLYLTDPEIVAWKKTLHTVWLHVMSHS